MKTTERLRLQNKMYVITIRKDIVDMIGLLPGDLVEIDLKKAKVD